MMKLAALLITIISAASAQEILDCDKFENEIEKGGKPCCYLISMPRLCYNLDDRMVDSISNDIADSAIKMNVKDVRKNYIGRKLYLKEDEEILDRFDAVQIISLKYELRGLQVYGNQYDFRGEKPGLKLKLVHGLDTSDRHCTISPGKIESLNCKGLSRTDIKASKNWSKQIWKKIEEHKVFIGMTKEQALLSWGDPEDINRTITASSTREQWVYESAYLYFENGILTTMQD